MLDESVRNKIFKELSKYLGNEIGKILEQSLFEFSKKYADDNETPFLIEQIYQSKSDELIYIVKDNLKFIIDSIKNKTIDPKKIPYMRKSELESNTTNDNLLDSKEGSDLFECPKCKRKNTSITEKQIKAADEPADIFITCLECGFSWMLD